MVPFLIALVVVIIIAAAFLYVVRAALATPPMKFLEPYATLLYALAVLIVVLLAVGHFYPSFRF